MKQTRSVLIVGATSQVAHFLLPRFSEAQCRVVAISRTDHRSRVLEHVTWEKLDVTADTAVLNDMNADALIYLAPLKTLADLLLSVDKFAIRRIIAFSSTSVMTKDKSSDAGERQYVRQLRDAEQTIGQCCQSLGIVLTIFRPTLIYGVGIDRNVSFIAKCITSVGLFPIAGGAKGRRQPVHAEDLAAACVQSLDESKTFNKTYALAGADILSYKEMVLKIFMALNRPPRIISLPIPVYKLMLRLMKLSTRFRYFLSPAMADRMNQDMIFDYSDAQQDFGFTPRGFQPTQDELAPGPPIAPGRPED